MGVWLGFMSAVITEFLGTELPRESCVEDTLGAELPRESCVWSVDTLGAELPGRAACGLWRAPWEQNCWLTCPRLLGTVGIFPGGATNATSFQPPWLLSSSTPFTNSRHFQHLLCYFGQFGGPSVAVFICISLTTTKAAHTSTGELGICISYCSTGLCVSFSLIMGTPYALWV